MTLFEACTNGTLGIMTDSQQIREIIREHIADINPLDDVEQNHAGDALAWIDAGSPLFRIERPDKPPKHLVAYFVMIDPDHRSVLLADHVNAQLWLPSGGHVEPDEHPVQTVKRESREELGRDAVFLRGVERPLFVTVNQTGGLTPGHTDVSLWYVLRGNVHDYVHFDRREFNDVTWFTFDEVLGSDPAIFDRNMHRFMRKLNVWLN